MPRSVSGFDVCDNFLARLVAKAPRFSSFVPILKRLHWLPVKFRIHLKICAITSRTLKDNHPAYLADLLVRPKCSTNSNRFVVARVVARIKLRLGQELSLYLVQP